MRTTDTATRSIHIIPWGRCSSRRTGTSSSRMAGSVALLGRTVKGRVGIGEVLRASIMIRKILIMGLPGAGKTTLARMVAARLNAVLFNADDVRANINKDLGFSEADRVEHARRMGWLCDQVTRTGGLAIADFICP